MMGGCAPLHLCFVLVLCFLAVAQAYVGTGCVVARASGAALPMTALVDQFYAEVEADGGRRWDTSSLVTRLPHGDARD